MQKVTVAAVVAAVVFVWFARDMVTPARAQGSGFSRCVVMQTEFIKNATELKEDKLPAIPPGWTALGGGGVLYKGSEWFGAVTVCK